IDKNQKTPASLPASEFCKEAHKPCCEEKTAIPDKIRYSGSYKSGRFALLLFIQVKHCLSIGALFSSICCRTLGTDSQISATPIFASAPPSALNPNLKHCQSDTR